MPKSNSSGSSKSEQSGFEESTSGKKRFAARGLNTISSIMIVPATASRKRMLIATIGYLTLVLELLQMLSYVQGQDTVGSSSTWHQIAYTFRSFAPFGIYNNTFLFYYVIALLYLFATTASAAWLLKTAEEGTASRRNVPLSVIGAFHLFPALITPILWLLMSPLTCGPNGVRLYPGVDGLPLPCWSTQYIVQFLLAIVGTGLVALFALFQGVLAYNPVFVTSDPLARQFSYFVPFWRLAKIPLAVVWSMGTSSTLLMGIFLVLAALPMLMRLLMRGIFYQAPTLLAYALTFGGGVGGGVALIFGDAQAASFVAFFWAFTGGVALLSVIVMYLRVRALIGVAHAAVYEPDSVETLRMAYVLGRAACKTEEEEQEVNATIMRHLVSLSSINPALRDHTITASCEILIEDGLNYQLCYLHMSNIMRRFRVEWLFGGLNQLCLRFLQLASLQHDQGMTRASRHVQKFHRLQRTVCNAIVDFYDELDAAVPDTNRLLKRIAYIDSVIARADALYQSAVNEDPSSTGIMYAYAFFASYVLRDSTTANQIRSLAGTVEGTASTHSAMLATVQSALTTESRAKLDEKLRRTQTPEIKKKKKKQTKEAAAMAALASMSGGGDGSDANGGETASKPKKKARFGTDVEMQVIDEAEQQQAAAAAELAAEEQQQKGGGGKAKKKKKKSTKMASDEAVVDDDVNEDEAQGKGDDDDSETSSSSSSSSASSVDMAFPDELAEHVGPRRHHHGDRRGSAEFEQLERGLRGGGVVSKPTTRSSRDRKSGGKSGGGGGGDRRGSIGGGSSARLSQLSTASVGAEKHRIMQERRNDLNGFVYSLNCALLVLLLAALAGISASLIMLSAYATDMDMLVTVGNVRDEYALSWGLATEMIMFEQGFAPGQYDAENDIPDAQAGLGEARMHLEEAVTEAFTFLQSTGADSAAFAEFTKEEVPYAVFSVNEDGRYSVQNHFESIVGGTHDMFVRMTELSRLNASEIFDPEPYLALNSLNENGLNLYEAFQHVITAFQANVNSTLDLALVVNAIILGVSIFVLLGVALVVIQPAFKRMSRDRIEGVSLFCDLPRELVQSVRAYYLRLLDEHDDLHSDGDDITDDGSAHASIEDEMARVSGSAGQGSGSAAPLTRENVRRRGSVGGPNAATLASGSRGSSSRRSTADRVLTGQLADKFKVWRTRVVIVLLLLAGVFGAIFGVSFSASTQLTGFALTVELASLRTASAILVRYMAIDLVGEVALHYNASVGHQVIGDGSLAWRQLVDTSGALDAEAEALIEEKSSAEALDAETVYFSKAAHYKLANSTFLRARMLEAVFDLYQTHLHLVSGDPERGLESSHNRYQAQTDLLFSTPPDCLHNTAVDEIECEPLSPLVTHVNFQVEGLGSLADESLTPTLPRFLDILDILDVLMDKLTLSQDLYLQEAQEVLNVQNALLFVLLVLVLLAFALIEVLVAIPMVRAMQGERMRTVSLLLMLPSTVIERIPAIQRFLLQGRGKREDLKTRLHNAQLLSKAVIETSRDAIVVLSEDGVVTMINPAFTHLFGYKSAEMVGKKLDVLMPDDEMAHKHRAALKSFLTGKKLAAARAAIAEKVDEMKRKASEDSAVDGAAAGGVSGSGTDADHMAAIEKVRAEFEQQQKDISSSSDHGVEVVAKRKDGTLVTVQHQVGRVRMGLTSYIIGFLHDLTAQKKAEEENERLLLSILPKSIADRVRARGFDTAAAAKAEPIADTYDNVTIIFADVVKFTPWSKQKSPAQVVATLNDLFGRFDRLCSAMKVCKVKLIGDCWMGVAGAPELLADHAAVAADFCLAAYEELNKSNAATGEHLQLRIGINSGPVFAGVIGVERMAYDIWGSAVNLAARMQACAPINGIVCGDSTYELLRDTYHFAMLGKQNLKGIGQSNIFELKYKYVTNTAAVADEVSRRRSSEAIAQAMKPNKLAAKKGARRRGAGRKNLDSVRERSGEALAEATAAVVAEQLQQQQQQQQGGGASFEPIMAAPQEAKVDGIKTESSTSGVDDSKS